jgi:hypothetical protein
MPVVILVPALDDWATVGRLQIAPDAGQVQYWDRRRVAISRVLDRLTGARAGRSVIGLWQRPAAA